jgi:Fe-S-cluster containining protein
LSIDIAELTFDPKTKRLMKIEFLSKNLRFKCQRCAVFCCKLGGPTLSAKDVQRLKQAGAKKENILRPTKDDGKFRLREREDGSCALLEYDVKSKKYACSVYSFRPSLCRLYPFEFKSTGLNTGMLRTIPLCNGLNAVDGELVDRKFIQKNLFGTHIGLHQNG